MSAKKLNPAVTNDQLGVTGDSMYEALLNAHSDLSDEQSHRLNARLVLLLMNQLANPQTFDDVLAAARSAALIDAAQPPPDSSNAPKS